MIECFYSLNDLRTSYILDIAVLIICLIAHILSMHNRIATYLHNSTLLRLFQCFGHSASNAITSRQMKMSEGIKKADLWRR